MDPITTIRLISPPPVPDSWSSKAPAAARGRGGRLGRAAARTVEVDWSAMRRPGRAAEWG